jgi:hypothetical protein
VPFATEPSLEGCYVKLARAERHRDELAAAIGPALEAVRVGVATETTYEP